MAVPVKVEFANKAGTRVRVTYDDGNTASVPTTEVGHKPWYEVLTLVSQGKLQIAPFNPNPHPELMTKSGRKKSVSA